MKKNINKREIGKLSLLLFITVSPILLLHYYWQHESASQEFTNFKIFCSLEIIEDLQPKQTPIYVFNTRQYPDDVEFSEDGEYFAVAGGRSMMLFKSSPPTLVMNYSTEGSVYCVSISRDGSYIACGVENRNKSFLLFNRTCPTPIWKFPITFGNPSDVAVSKDGNYIACSEWENRKIYLFNNTHPDYLWSFKADTFVSSVAISEHGDYIASATYNRIYLFNKTSGTPMWNFSKNGAAFPNILISQNGEYIVTATMESWPTIHFFRKNSSQPIWNLTLNAYFEDIAISENAEYILAGTDDWLLYFNNSNFIQPILTFNYTTKSTPWMVDISLHGKYFTACDTLNNLYYFNSSTGKLLWVFHSERAIEDVSMSGDGDYVLAGAEKYYIYLFQQERNEQSHNSLLNLLIFIYLL